MNPYCHPFVHDYQLPTLEQLYPQGRQILAPISLELLDPRFLAWVCDHGLTVKEPMVAWKPPMSPEIKNTSWGTVHSDNTDSAKINFIIGGKLSEMLWFSDIDLLAPAQTMTGSRHRRAIDLGTLKVVHRASFTAALVNAEPLHYIINTQEHRYAIQCI